MAVLCAQRAGNRGLEVVLATSTDATDNAVENAAKVYGIACVRGSLDDVLGRFLLATEGMKEDDWVIRLTADNLFPDGDFLAEFLKATKLGEFNYTRSASPQNRLPYGLGAEAFRVGLLRKAAGATREPYDREHVTPWMLRLGNFTSFDPRENLEPDWSRLRASIDTYGDYLRVSKLFAGEKKPSALRWRELCTRLARLPGHRLVLGGAQLGLSYGQTNRSGKPTEERAHQILEAALELGVEDVDCARGYGDSEKVVGSFLKKYPQALTPITKLSADALTEVAARESVRMSCSELGVEKLPVLLLHRWQHRHADGGKVWASLKELRDSGMIGLLGASVTSPEQALEALADPDIRLLQLPFNLLDHRWDDSGIPGAARARPDVEIHARSIFLQGILLNESVSWPAVEGLNAELWTAKVKDGVARSGRKDRMDLCLAYARSQPWINALVAGVESPAQLAQIGSSFAESLLGEAELLHLRELYRGAPVNLVDPSLWPRSLA